MPHYLRTYTPEEFGAAGDGLRDDSVEIQAAADAARAAGHPLIFQRPAYKASITWRRGYDWRGLALDTNGAPATMIFGLTATMNKSAG